MIEFYKAKDCVGLFGVMILDKYVLHFFPREKQDRFWGKIVLDRGDILLHLFGFGPLLLLAIYKGESEE